MEELKGRLESLLFASGRKLSTEQLGKLAKERDLEVIRAALRKLSAELDEKQSSLMLIEENDEWKFAVREKYLPYVRKIVTKTELPKSILETLAVVAYKAPALQSQIIKIRTNKAYKHLDELEQLSYISREKKGRTKLIKLTQKFFEYFDVPPEKLKEKFKKVETYETAERVEEKLPSPVKITGEKMQGLEVYKSMPPKEEQKEQLGELPVYDIPQGEEHEHRRFHRAAKPEGAVPEKPPAAPVEAVPEEKPPEEAPPEKPPEEIVAEAVAELKPEELKPEVKELIAAVQKEKVNGVFPAGVPEEVKKAAAARVEEILRPKEKKEEETEELDEEFHKT